MIKEDPFTAYNVFLYILGEGNVEGSTEFSGNMDAEGSSVLTDETSSGDAYSGTLC